MKTIDELWREQVEDLELWAMTYEWLLVETKIPEIVELQKPFDYIIYRFYLTPTGFTLRLQAIYIYFA